jgi:hypothetical protein
MQWWDCDVNGNLPEFMSMRSPAELNYSVPDAGRPTPGSHQRGGSETLVMVPQDGILFPSVSEM